MKKVIAIICTLLFIGCTNSIECEKFASVEKDRPAIDSLFASIRPLLKKLDKKEIHDYKGEVYWVWSFHSLLEKNYVVEFAKNGKEAVLRFEVILSDTDKGTIKVAERWEKTLPKEGWKHIIFLVKRYKFWKSDVIIERELADGLLYYVEGHKPGCNESISKIISRASPDDADEIGWLCEDLIILGERFKNKH